MEEISYIPKNKYRTTLYLDFGIVQKFKEKYPISVSKVVNALLHAIVEGKSPLESLNLGNLHGKESSGSVARPIMWDSHSHDRGSNPRRSIEKKVESSFRSLL